MLISVMKAPDAGSMQTSRFGTSPKVLNGVKKKQRSSLRPLHLGAKLVFISRPTKNISRKGVQGRKGRSKSCWFSLRPLRLGVKTSLSWPGFKIQ